MRLEGCLAIRVNLSPFHVLCAAEPPVASFYLFTLQLDGLQFFLWSGWMGSRMYCNRGISGLFCFRYPIGAVDSQQVYKKGWQSRIVLCVGRGVLQFKSSCSVVRTPSVTGGGLACKSSETHLNEGCACLALAPFLRHFGSSCLWVGSDCHLRLRTGADVLFILVQTQTSQLRNRCYFVSLPPGFIMLLFAVLGGMSAAGTSWANSPGRAMCCC